MARKHWKHEDIEDQRGRVAVVTGANSGIGYETAKALATKGATVIVATRNEGRGQAAISNLRRESPEANVDLMLLDLASQGSVREFATVFNARYSSLDLLINNAGVMMPPARQETQDGFELQIGTNHLGHFALTLLLLDRLVATEGSRVVTVASSAQNFGKLDIDDLQWTERPFHRMASYGASKIANMLFTLELQRRFDKAGVSTMATSAHPGFTATNLQRSSPLFRLLGSLIAMKPQQGALPTLYAAVAGEAEAGGYYGPHGMGSIRGYPVPNSPAEASRDLQMAARLWTASEDLVGLNWPDLSTQRGAPRPE